MENATTTITLALVHLGTNLLQMRHIAHYLFVMSRALEALHHRVLLQTHAHVHALPKEQSATYSHAKHAKICPPAPIMVNALKQTHFVNAAEGFQEKIANYLQVKFIAIQLVQHQQIPLIFLRKQLSI